MVINKIHNTKHNKYNFNNVNRAKCMAVSSSLKSVDDQICQNTTLTGTHHTPHSHANELP